MVWNLGLRQIEPATRLAAGWIATGLVLLAVRCWTLHLAEVTSPQPLVLLPWIAFASYQDILLLTILGWGSCHTVSKCRTRTARLATCTFFWSMILCVAAYAILSAEIYRLLKAPLTWRLIEMSDRLRGIEASIAAATNSGKFALILAGPVSAIVVARLILRFRPAWAGWLVTLHHRRKSLAAGCLYISASAVWANNWLLDPSVTSNPHWAFVKSLLSNPDPFVDGKFDQTDLSDFDPTQIRNSRGLAENSAAPQPPLNVVLFVMESAGANYMEAGGARWQNTPNLKRLAKNAVSFSRFYASHPHTSSAMASIFCSVYPYHGWRPLPGRAPRVHLPGIGDVLGEQGYRTAFLHTGDLSFDHQRDFLEAHGFEIVADVANFPPESGAPDPSSPENVGYNMLADEWLLPAAIQWIDQQPDRPFFLTLWTIQTHHPYVPTKSKKQFTNDEDLNRYLNAIADGDRVIAEIYADLKRRKLADRTLFIVLGDHGDAFGQHGRRLHGQTLYEEEVRIPFLVINPALFRARQKSEELGQQIDIGPTILGQLGLPIPESWQGRDLFRQGGADRVYLFTAYNHYSFGLVQGRFKYIYDATAERHELYDLFEDPNEKNNLSALAEHQRMVSESRRRLAAWFHYQNTYLSSHIRDGDASSPAYFETAQEFLGHTHRHDRAPIVRGN